MTAAPFKRQFNFNYMQYQFRGKRKDNGEWVYGSLLIRGNKSFIIALIESRIPDYSVENSAGAHGYTWAIEEVRHEVVPETVGMWIGLKDKKGIDIYDGDIIIHERRSRPFSKLAKTATVTCRVQWDSGLTEGEGKNNPSSFNRNPEFVAHPIDRKAEASNWGHSWSEFHDCEVIGNVYDKKELSASTDN